MTTLTPCERRAWELAEPFLFDSRLWDPEFQSYSLTMAGCLTEEACERVAQQFVVAAVPCRDGGVGSARRAIA